MNAHERMVRTRTRLLLDHPWFGSLAMRLKLVEFDCPTMQTDGSTLRFNAEFVAKQSDAHLLTIMAHEVMHCALLHPFRRGSRDHDTWNDACDYAINSDLQKSGFVMPPGALMDSQYAGLSADTIFAKLYAKPKPQPGEEEPEPCTGTVEDAPQELTQTAATGMTEEDWKIAGEQATSVSKACGSVPGDAVRSTKAARQVPEDWRSILREFIEHQAPSDYSWGSPNRRYVAEGLYLPGIVKEKLSYIGVCVDTSGSVDDKVLAAFAQELTALVQEARPGRVSVVYCDTCVRHTQEFTPDDLEINLEASGGGGTRFAPALKHFADCEEHPAAVLYFTDLENGMEELEEPVFPVLWVTGKNVTKSAPFGPLIRIDAYV